MPAFASELPARWAGRLLASPACMQTPMSPSRGLIGALCVLALLPACRAAAQREASKPQSAAFFIAPGAQKVEQREQDGVRDLNYGVATAYPAGPFLCELTHYLDGQQWRGLRESPFDPGARASLVSGWADYEDGTRQPNTHVHAWMSAWLNPNGDLLIYALQYQYPQGARPDLSTLKVHAVIMPSGVVRTQLGPRADQLQALLLPATSAVREESSVASVSQCAQPQWSEFVALKSVGTTPVRALPYELGAVQSVFIESDTDGLAGRIAKDLEARVQNLHVSTVYDPPSESPDATLDFRSECRCNEPGLPNGFYIREAVVYRPGTPGAEPARVLFHWTDGGEPAWRREVPASCLGQKPLSAACRASFEQADIAFTAALASALANAQGQADWHGAGERRSR